MGHGMRKKSKSKSMRLAMKINKNLSKSMKLYLDFVGSELVLDTFCNIYLTKI